MIDEVKEMLSKAEERRGRVRKQVDAGVTHETHLAHADGVVDGVQSVLATLENHASDCMASDDSNQKMTVLLFRLVEMDWCAGYELTPGQHRELDDIRTKAGELFGRL